MNAVATTARPTMPVAARWKVALSRELRGDAPVIADNDPLIPPAECRAIIDEMTGALARCSPDAAAKHARLIVAAYGAQKPDDPDNYVRLLTAAVCQCPPDLLAKLVDEVSRRNPRFLPSKGEVDAAVRDLTRLRSTARQIANAHLAAHTKREREKPAAPLLRDQPPEERDAFLAELRRRMPEGFGLVEAKAP